MKHLSFIFLLSLAGCAGERDFPEVKKLSEYKQTEFVATPQNALPKNKNAVYSVPMVYVWQQIAAMAKGQISIDKTYNDLNLLNNSKSGEKALLQDDYIATATVEEGNRIVAFAEFSKSLPLTVKLKDYGKELKFKGEAVPAFGCNASEFYEFELYKSINILYYKNDNDFAVRLNPKDTGHEILLYMPDKKGNDLQQMFYSLKEKAESAIKEKQSGEASWKYSIDMEGDELLITKFSFNIETNYGKLEGSEFMMANERYVIEKVYQRIAFILDEEGAKVESEAIMEATTEEMPEPVEKPHAQKLHFNKPFLVLLKRKDSPNPYFAMWVDNTELMQKD